MYCDPPYSGTCKYVSGKFDHDAFYEWLRTRDFPVYISEYSMPNDFTVIWEKKKMVRKCATQTTDAIERLFVHERWKDSIYKFDSFG